MNERTHAGESEQEPGGSAEESEDERFGKELSAHLPRTCAECDANRELALPSLCA
jgi:hypothetical protein